MELTICGAGGRRYEELHVDQLVDCECAITAYDLDNPEGASVVLTREQTVRVVAHLLVGLIAQDRCGHTARDLDGCGLRALIPGLGDAIQAEAERILG